MKNPTVSGGAVEKLAGDFHALSTLSALRVQHLMARHALPIETAAIVSALAFGGHHHG